MSSNNKKKDDNDSNINSNVNKCFKVPDKIYKEMDENNQKAADVWATKGEKEMIKYMFTDQNTGRTLSYAEMRSLYG